jgi:hypothetical protein
MAWSELVSYKMNIQEHGKSITHSFFARRVFNQL